METQTTPLVQTVLDWIDHRRVVVISTANSLVLFGTILFASFAVRPDSLSPSIAEAAPAERSKISREESRQVGDPHHRRVEDPTAARGQKHPRRWSPRDAKSFRTTRETRSR